jgi:hypothetical protein
MLLSEETQLPWMVKEWQAHHENHTSCIFLYFTSRVPEKKAS